MEEIKAFIYDEVIWELDYYHHISTDEQLVEKVNRIIDEEYDNFIQNPNNWEPDPYIEKVINRITLSFKG